ncbi:MAG TPA: serine/threonine-protein kinase [Gemmatimonadaceae bacterium]|jgi:serine/threonine-protein kinase
MQAALGDTLVLERELATGVTAHLYVARETALGRRVVLKLLPTEQSNTVDATRFRREIELAAQLPHPNIVPLLTAGQAAGCVYYTMPLVDGESLYARLRREGKLPIADVISIARDIARALAFAHEHAVIHRDLKPDNILLERGTAMLTDFGLAKALIAGTSATAHGTAPGIAVGTPTYVSPEQGAGDPHVDHRGDLYSLGIVAYEMLTGRPPFNHRALVALLAAHRNDPPPPMANLRPDIPPWLDGLVLQLLEKRPADRPQSAEEVLRQIEVATALSPAEPLRSASRRTDDRAHPFAYRWARRLAGLALVFSAGAIAAHDKQLARAQRTGAVRASPAHENRLAVLPFTIVGRDSISQLVAAGLTAELTTNLDAIQGLRVASRTSVMALRARGLPPLEIADSLRVRHVLEGTVERLGNRLLITVQLVGGRRGLELWSATYERQTASGLAVQHDVAEEITRAVAQRLSGTARQATAASNCDASGMVNEKLLPVPGLLSTVIVPPCASTMHLAIANPRPKPPLALRSARQKRSNT